MSTRINEKNKERLDRINSYLIQEKQEDVHYSYDNLVSILIDSYFEVKGLQNNDSFDQDKEWVRYKKLDANITKSTREEINLIIKFMKKRGMIDNKTTIPQFIEYMIRYIKYDNPEIKEYMEKQFLFHTNRAALNRHYGN